MEVTEASINDTESASSLRKYENVIKYINVYKIKNVSNNHLCLQLMSGNNREQFPVSEESTMADPEIINPHFADRVPLYTMDLP